MVRNYSFPDKVYTNHEALPDSVFLSVRVQMLFTGVELL